VGLDPGGRDIAGRLARVRERIERARQRGGRRDPVRLVAVSKAASLAAVAEACAAGQRDFGENRVQDALPRVQALPPLLTDRGLASADVRWHFLGHIQGNKARRAIGPFQLLHAVDSWPLARRLDAAAGEQGRRQAVLVEVNMSREPQKSGVAPDAVAGLAVLIAGCPQLELAGLMTMARFDAPEPELRATFGGLRRLAEETRAASGFPLPDLSMGMSADFEIAVEEGATIVRVGTAIFGPRG